LTLDNASNIAIKTEYQGMSNVVDGATVISDLGTPHVWITEVTATTEGVTISLWDNPAYPKEPDLPEDDGDELNEPYRCIRIDFEDLLKDNWKELLRTLD